MPSPFGLFDDGDPSDPTYRSAMMPVGTYKNPDGSERLGFAWPGMITEPINALSRLADNSRFPDGRLGIPNPQNQDNQNDVLTALLSTYGGNALSPTRMLEGAATKTVPESAKYVPLYHGTSSAQDFANLNQGAARRKQERGVFFGDRPDVADLYAAADDGTFESGRVFRAYAPRDSILDYDMARFSSDPVANAMADAQEAGKSIVRFTRGTQPPTYMALHTGDLVYQDQMAQRLGQLFSDTGKPSLFGSAVAAAGANPTNTASGFNLRDTAQAIYRTLRYPGETAVSDIPAPLLSHQQTNWPEALPAATRREGRFGYDMVDDVSVPNANQTWHNMRSGNPIGGADNDFDLGALNTGYLNAVLRQRKIDDGSLFSDTGRPSILGGLLADDPQQRRNSLLDY